MCSAMETHDPSKLISVYMVEAKKRWLKAFNGISTKQLDPYLAWFMWAQQHKELTERAKLNALVETLTQ